MTTEKSQTDCEINRYIIHCPVLLNRLESCVCVRDAGLLIVSLAATYLLSTFKSCDCLRKKKKSLPPEVVRPAPRQRHRPVTSVEMMSSPTAKLVHHEVQWPSDEFSPAGVAYDQTGHTTAVQPAREDAAGYAYTKSLPSGGRSSPTPSIAEQDWYRAESYRVPMTPSVASDPRSMMMLNRH